MSTPSYDYINQFSRTMTQLLSEYDALVAELANSKVENAALKAESEVLKAEIERLKKIIDGAGTPSGERAPTDDLPGWTHTWAEDFDTNMALGTFPGPYLNSVRAYPNNYYDTSNNIAARRDNGTSGQYNPATVLEVKDGVMIKHLHTEGKRPQVAALVPYIGGTGKWPGQLYGRYAIRMRVPAPIPGYKIAWLLWPDSGTNTAGSPDGVGGNGEIDFPETNLKTLASVGGFVHRQNATSGTDQYATGNIPVDMRNWHTYVIEWSPNLVVFLLDGREVGRTIDRVPKTAMHWVIQTETEISSTPPAVDVKGDLLIDWASIWKRAA